MADDLAPHPLVVQVGIGLCSDDEALEAAVVALAKAKEEAVAEAAAAEPEAQPAAKILDDDAVAGDEKAEVAKQVVARVDRSELGLFAGYLGPQIDRGGTKWRLLFVDARLRQWLQFPSDDIVAETRQADQSAAFGKRDVVWLRGDAPVIRGHAPRSAEGRFLSGDLTRAADIEAGSGGAPEGGATGLFCEATTPFCCIGSRSRR
jgi:hypothetical protein